MPQPLGRNKTRSVLFPWQYPADRAECAAAMMGVMIMWVQLEEELVGLLATATGNVSEAEDGGWHGTENAISRAALSAIDSLAARLALVDAVWGAIKLPDALRKEFVLLGQKIRKAAGWRNQVAHDRWWITDAYPSDVVSSKDMKRYTPKDFDDMRGRIKDVQREVVSFSDKCVRHFMKKPARQSSRYVAQVQLNLPPQDE